MLMAAVATAKFFLRPLRTIMYARRHLALLFVLIAFGTIAAAGCGKQGEKGATGDAKSGDSKSGAGADSEIEKALAALSPEDRAAAKKQKTCPVGGGDLGSMGTPKIVEVKGQKVFICCDGCRKAVEEDPDKYLALINK